MRLNFVVVFIVLSLTAAIFSFNRGPEGVSAPRAQQGVLDLRSVDLDRQATVNLDGEWDFYWQRFVAAQAFENIPTAPSDGLISLPGSWKGKTFAGRQADEQALRRCICAS